MGKALAEQFPLTGELEAELQEDARLALERMAAAQGLKTLAQVAEEAEGLYGLCLCYI